MQTISICNIICAISDIYSNIISNIFSNIWCPHLTYRQDKPILVHAQLLWDVLPPIRGTFNHLA